MSKKIIQPNKQIVSPAGQAMSSRPAMSDQQAIELILGGYIEFLRINGIPVPSKEGLLRLLYEKCYADYLKAVRDQEEKQWMELRKNLPRLRRAAALIDDEDRKAKEEIEKSTQNKELTDTEKEADKQTELARQEIAKKKFQENSNVTREEK